MYAYAYLYLQAEQQSITSHQWLVYKCTSLSAEDVLDNSGQIQLEAMLRLMYISTLICWHVHL